MGEEINKVCKNDGKDQMFYILAYLLGLVTFGIYPVYWCYKAMERLRDNAYRYGNFVNPEHSGASFVLWMYLGSFILVGPMVAFCQFISNLNKFADVYGYVEPLPYSHSTVERQAMAQQNPNGQQNPYGHGNGNIPNYPQINDGQQGQNYGENNGIIDEVPPTRPAVGFQPKNISGVVTGINGMYAGMPIPIQVDEEIVIGVDPAQCNIVIASDSGIISRKHCSIRFNGGQNTYTVVDFSTNGTFLGNGERLLNNAPKIVESGTVIMIGNGENSFRLG